MAARDGLARRPRAAQCQLSNPSSRHHAAAHDNPSLALRNRSVTTRGCARGSPRLMHRHTSESPRAKATSSTRGKAVVGGWSPDSSSGKSIIAICSGPGDDPTPTGQRTRSPISLQCGRDRAAERRTARGLRRRRTRALAEQSDVGGARIPELHAIARSARLPGPQQPRRVPAPSLRPSRKWASDAGRGSDS